MPPAFASIRRSTWLALALCLVGAFILRNVGIDDVGISYRYARHLAEGHGLTWNVGEPPVEGFSNLLWVIILAACRVVGFDIEVSARILGLMLGLATLLLFSRLLEKIGFHNRHGIVPVLVAITPPWLMWMISGLEIALYGFLLVVAMFALTLEGRSRTITMAASLLALILTRPEGMALAGAYLVATFLLTVRSERAAWRRLLVPAVVVILTAAAVTIFRVLYFGYPMPNTVYAKFSTIFPSLSRVGEWLILAAPFLAIWAFTARQWWMSSVRVPMAVALTLIALQTILILPVNPVMHFLHRYTIAYLPLLLLPIPFLLTRLQPRLATGAIVVLAPWLMQDMVSVRQYHEANAYLLERQQCVMADLGKLPGTPRIALIDSGRIPYWTDYPAIDISGLCDRGIAHEGFAPTRVLEHPHGSPDVLIMAQEKTSHGPDYPFGPDRIILGQPRFVERYDLWTVCSGREPDGGSQYRFYNYAIFLRVK